MFFIYDVFIPNVNDAALFVTKAACYPFDVDYRKGRHSVDAKSLMGVLSLGIGHQCELNVHSTDDELLKKFEKEMDMWIVEK